MITAQQEIVPIFFLKKFFQTIVTINRIIITISFLVVKPRCNCKIKTSSLPPWTQFQRVLVAAGGKFSKFDVTIRATRAPSHKTREREKGRPRMETGFSTKNRKISEFLSLGRKSGFPTFYALLPLFLFLFSFLSSFFFFFHSFPATDEGEKIAGERRKEDPLDPNFSVFPSEKENSNISILGLARILF